MCDLVPFRILEMTNRCVSWTAWSSCCLPPLGVSLPPFISCLTITRERRFFSASPLVSQLSNIIFSNSLFLFPKTHTFPSPALLIQKTMTTHWPRKTPLAGCGPMTHSDFLQSSFTGYWWYKESQHWARTVFCTAKTGQSISPEPLTMCPEGHTHNNAVPHCAQYYLQDLIALQRKEVFIVSKPI